MQTMIGLFDSSRVSVVRLHRLLTLMTTGLFGSSGRVVEIVRWGL